MRENSLGPPESELEYEDHEPFTSVAVNTPAPPKTTLAYRNGHRLVPDPEPDYEDPEIGPFTSVTVNTPAHPKTTYPKTTYRNGNRLVHRVHMAAETAPVSLTYTLLKLKH
jgi:hypothetical protein